MKQSDIFYIDLIHFKVKYLSVSTNNALCYAYLISNSRLSLPCLGVLFTLKSLKLTFPGVFVGFSNGRISVIKKTARLPSVKKLFNRFA